MFIYLSCLVAVYLNRFCVHVQETVCFTENYNRSLFSKEMILLRAVILHVGLTTEIINSILALISLKKNVFYDLNFFLGFFFQN